MTDYLEHLLMWTPEQALYARQVAALYGASGFVLDLAGNLSAVVGPENFPVMGEHVYFGPSDAQLAANALAKAQGTAPGTVAPTPGV